MQYNFRVPLLVTTTRVTVSTCGNPPVWQCNGLRDWPEPPGYCLHGAKDHAGSSQYWARTLFVYRDGRRTRGWWGDRGRSRNGDPNTDGGVPRWIFQP
jgi:hypothetical protein